MMLLMAGLRGWLRKGWTLCMACVMMSFEWRYNVV